MKKDKKDKGGIFQRLRRGLAKTQGLLVGGADDLLRPGRGLDEDLYEDLEEGGGRGAGGVDVDIAGGVDIAPCYTAVGEGMNVAVC